MTLHQTDHTPPAQTDFRHAMSRLGAAVNIITTDGTAGRHGITASAVCSVSDTPPILLVCINRTSSAHDLVLGNGVFCVNVLAHNHADLALRFGRPGLSPEDRFTGGDWSVLATGAPTLGDAAVALDCDVTTVTEAGTHSVIIGTVRALRMGEDSPAGLVYFDRDFHRLGAATAS